MAYVHTDRVAVANHSMVGGFIADIRAALARRKIYAQTLSELRQLTDRELNDLGLSRSEIVAVAREAAYGK